MGFVNLTGADVEIQHPDHPLSEIGSKIVKLLPGLERGKDLVTSPGALRADYTYIIPKSVLPPRWINGRWPIDSRGDHKMWHSAESALPKPRNGVLYILSTPEALICAGSGRDDVLVYNSALFRLETVASDTLTQRGIWISTRASLLSTFREAASRLLAGDSEFRLEDVLNATGTYIELTVMRGGGHLNHFPVWEFNDGHLDDVGAEALSAINSAIAWVEGKLNQS